MVGKREVQYETIFVITGKNFQWWPSLSVLAFALVLALAAIIAHRRKESLRMWGLVGFSVMSFVIAVLLFAGMYSEFRTLRTAYLDGKYEVAEGTIQDFTPIGKGGSREERFTVAGQRFSYSDFELTPAFNQSTLKGGPMRQGLQVRIYHLRGRILRVDVRNHSLSMPENGKAIQNR